MKRDSGVEFWPIGLYWTDTEIEPLADNPYKNINPESKWRMNTLSGIAKLLNHSDDVIIDVVKMDVEESEYGAIAQALDERFLQRCVATLLVEWHLFGSREELFRPDKEGNVKLQKLLSIYKRLHDPDDGGFAIVYSQQRTLGHVFFQVETLVNKKLFGL